MKKKVFARSAVIDHNTGDLRLDGISLPWWQTVDGPQVSNLEGLVNVVTIEIIVDGPVTVVPKTPTRPLIFDAQFGPVGDYARELVRKGFAEAFPWLEAAK